MLVGNPHQDQAAKPRLDILLGDVGRCAAELRRHHVAHRLHRRRDRNLVEPDAKPAGEIGRVIEAFLAGIG